MIKSGIGWCSEICALFGSLEDWKMVVLSSKSLKAMLCDGYLGTIEDDEG
jgi:hypothetical protein